MTKIETEARAAIERGAKWLDGEWPEWPGKIDVARLDVSTAIFTEGGCGCVCAQLDAKANGDVEGDYEEFYRNSFPVLDGDDGATFAEAHGFEPFDPDEREDGDAHYALWGTSFANDAWREEIAARLNP